MLASLSLWFLPRELVYFVMWVLICGGVLSAVYLAFIALKLLGKRFAPRLPFPNVRADAGVPYGMAAAVGFAIAFRFVG